ncbi:MAG: MarR family winged helix-turn-helix transcriptional regulator [Pseudomonadota bacterium]
MAEDDVHTAMEIDHVGVDLWHATRAYEAAMFRAIAETGHTVTLADSDVLAFVGPNGVRSSEIARGRRVSKQAAQEQVQRLVARGYLTIAPDPEDGRAKRVSLTAKGEALMRDFVGVKRKLHQQVMDLLGPQDTRHLRLVLQRITAQMSDGDETA